MVRTNFTFDNILQWHFNEKLDYLNIYEEEESMI